MSKETMPVVLGLRRVYGSFDAEKTNFMFEKAKERKQCEHLNENFK